MRFTTLLSATAAAVASADKVLPIFKSQLPAEAETAFNNTYTAFLAEFPADQHAILMDQITSGVESYLKSKAFVGVPGQAACEGSAGSIALPSKVAAYPGGATKRVFGMDL